jgi:DNA-binding transcriptional MerR regulator
MELTQSDRRYSADELTALASIQRRTLRYYIQLGLVDRPVGETRSAFYTWQHLRQLLEIRQLVEQGFSLERIGELMRGEAEPPDGSAQPRAGSVTVRSHIHLADGVALVVDPVQAQLSPEQLRRFAREAATAYERAVADTTSKET